MVAEIGTDMSVFPTARHLASWAGGCPGNDQSAGKRRSGRTRKGSKWLGIALEEAALAAIRTKDTYLAAQYQRLKPRLGHGRALGAVKHSMLVAYWHMFTTGETYRDLGGDYFQRRDPARATKRLVAKLQALGHTRHARTSSCLNTSGISHQRYHSVRARSNASQRPGGRRSSRSGAVAVRQHIAAGHLPAIKRGRSWWLDKRGVERMARQRRSGRRPLSPEMAWSVLLLASGDERAAEEAAGRDYWLRVRTWLSGHSLRENAPRLRARARTEEFDVHPSELRRILGRPDVLATGASLGDAVGWSAQPRL